MPMENVSMVTIMTGDVKLTNQLLQLRIKLIKHASTNNHRWHKYNKSILLQFTNMF